MLNHIVLMGRLTRDPELRRTGSGVAVASFTLAVDRDYAAQGAEKETDFVDIVAWRNTAEFVSKYFAKGRMAVVSGRLQIRNWTDKEAPLGGGRCRQRLLRRQQARQCRRRLVQPVAGLRAELQSGSAAAGVSGAAERVCRLV